MNPIETLRLRVEAIDTELRSIHEAAGDRELNEDESTRWAALETEQDEVRQEITVAEERAARADRVAESRARWNSLQVGMPVDNDNVDVRKLGAQEAVDRALKRTEVEGPRISMRDESQAKVEQMLRSSTSDRSAGHIARRLLLTENDAYRSAFAKAMVSATPAWTSDEARAIDEFRRWEERAMSEGSTTGGGYGVPVLIDPTIILTSQGSLNPFRQIARVETITTNQWKGVSSAGVSWSFDAEAAEVSDDSPVPLAQPTIPLQTARGFVPFSIELSDDYPGFASEIGFLLAEGYDELLAQKLAVGAGSGSNEPLGIVTALDADTNVEVVVTTDGALGAVDITKVWKALPDRAKANATWVMGAGTASDIAALGDAYGTRTTDLTGSLERLRNRPVAVSSYIPDFAGALTAQNLVVVGDFRKFLVAERAGMSVELVPHLIGTTNNRPTGQRGWFAWARIGSGVIDIHAFRLLQNQ